MVFMDSIQLKMNGIYDERTLKCLEKRDILLLGLDFRPRSFNFLQEHKFFELLENIEQESKLKKGHFFLHFQNEAPFVIEKILADIKNYCYDSGWSFSKFSLEFSDTQLSSYYDLFETPFLWHYTPGGSLKEVMKCRYLEGIVLSHKQLEEFHREGKLYSFLQTFHSLTTDKPMKIFLSLNWDTNLITSLFELFDFDGVSLEIDRQVETCYRNVNLPIVEKNLDFLGHHFDRNIEKE